MSIEALSAVKPRQTGNASRKAVLLVLADYADEAWSCYPSQERLANETELSVRTVRRLLAELEADGLIRREMRRGEGGHRSSDRIILVRQAIASLPAKLTAWQESQPATDDSQPATDDSSNRSQEPGNRQLNHQKKRASASARPTAWAPHENHVAKAKALDVDVAHEAEQFCHFHDAKGSRFVDWDAAFYTWLGNAGTRFRSNVAPLRRQQRADRDHWAFG